jgi:hypothetical protein
VSRAFISYSHHHDQAYVLRLATFLEQQRIPVWFDKEIISGDRWDAVIRQQIDACRAFIVVMSPAAEASSWVAREITEAEQQNKPILPLLVAGRNFFRLGHIQYEDVTGGKLPSAAYVERVRASLEGRPPSVISMRQPARPQQVRRRKLLMFGGFAGLVSLGGAGVAIKLLSDDGQGGQGPGATGHPQTSTSGSHPDTASTPPSTSAPPATTPGTPPPPTLKYQLESSLVQGLGIFQKVAFSPTGALASAQGNGVKLWRFQAFSGKWQSLDLLPTTNMNSVAFSPDGSTIAGAGSDHLVRLWHTDGSSAGDPLDLGSIASSVAFATNGNLATATESGIVQIRQGTTTTVMQSISGAGALLLDMVFSTDGKQLATATGSGAKLWQADGGQLLRTIDQRAFCVAFSPDSTEIATGRADHTARIWLNASGDQVLILNGHTDVVYGVAYSPDGTHLATASKDQTVRIWRRQTGELVQTLQNHTAPVQSVAFSADGGHLASAGQDGVRVYRRTAT